MGNRGRFRRLQDFIACQSFQKNLLGRCFGPLRPGFRPRLCHYLADVHGARHV